MNFFYSVIFVTLVSFLLPTKLLYAADQSIIKSQNEQTEIRSQNELTKGKSKEATTYEPLDFSLYLSFGVQSVSEYKNATIVVVGAEIKLDRYFRNLNAEVSISKNMNDHIREEREYNSEQGQYVNYETRLKITTLRIYAVHPFHSFEKRRIQLQGKFGAIYRREKLESTSEDHSIAIENSDQNKEVLDLSVALNLSTYFSDSSEIVFDLSLLGSGVQSYTLGYRYNF